MREKTLTILLIILLILNIVGLVFQYLFMTRLGVDIDVARGRQPTGLYQAIRATGNACLVCASETKDLSSKLGELESKVTNLSYEVSRLKKEVFKP